MQVVKAKNSLTYLFRTESRREHLSKLSAFPLLQKIQYLETFAPPNENITY